MWKIKYYSDIFITVKLESVPLKFVSQNLDGKNILL